jgi:hypothetical protein
LVFFICEQLSCVVCFFSDDRWVRDIVLVNGVSPLRMNSWDLLRFEDGEYRIFSTVFQHRKILSMRAFFIMYFLCRFLCVEVSFWIYLTAWKMSWEETRLKRIKVNAIIFYCAFPCWFLPEFRPEVVWS